MIIIILYLFINYILYYINIYKLIRILVGICFFDGVENRERLLEDPNNNYKL